MTKECVDAPRNIKVQNVKNQLQQKIIHVILTAYMVVFVRLDMVHQYVSALMAGQA